MAVLGCMHATERAPSSLSTSSMSIGGSAAAAAGFAFRPKLALGLSWKLFRAKLWVTAFVRSHSGLGDQDSVSGMCPVSAC